MSGRAAYEVVLETYLTEIVLHQSVVEMFTAYEFCTKRQHTIFLFLHYSIIISQVSPPPSSKDLVPLQSVTFANHDKRLMQAKTFKVYNHLVMPSRLFAYK